MNLPCSRWLRLGALALLLAGCSKHSPPEPLSLDHAEEALESAFQQADENFRQMVQRIQTSIQNRDYAGAHMQLSRLSADPNLAPEQRQVISQLFISVNQELAKAGAAGDQRAAEVLRHHRMNK